LGQSAARACVHPLCTYAAPLCTIHPHLPAPHPPAPCMLPLPPAHPGPEAGGARPTHTRRDGGQGGAPARVDRAAAGRPRAAVPRGVPARGQARAVPCAACRVLCCVVMSVLQDTWHRGTVAAHAWCWSCMGSGCLTTYCVPITPAGGRSSATGTRASSCCGMPTSSRGRPSLALPPPHVVIGFMEGWFCLEPYLNLVFMPLNGDTDQSKW
jgi:hypothetical protein